MIRHVANALGYLGCLGLASSSLLTAQSTGFPVCQFVRGDANADTLVDISDVIYILSYSDGSLAETPRNLDALDTNDDGTIDVGDAVYLVTAVFQGGTPPPAPFPAMGVDPTKDGLMTFCNADFLTPALRELLEDASEGAETPILAETVTEIEDVVLFDVDGDNIEEAIVRYESQDQFFVMSMDLNDPDAGFLNDLVVPLRSDFAIPIEFDGVTHLAVCDYSGAIEVHAPGSSLAAPVFSAQVAGFEVPVRFSDRIAFVSGRDVTILRPAVGGGLMTETLSSVPMTGDILFALRRPSDDALVFASGLHEFVAWTGTQFVNVASDFGQLNPIGGASDVWQQDIDGLGRVLVVENAAFSGGTSTSWSCQFYSWPISGSLTLLGQVSSGSQVPSYVFLRPGGELAFSSVDGAGILSWTLGSVSQTGVSLQISGASTDSALAQQGAAPSIPDATARILDKNSKDTAGRDLARGLAEPINGSNPMTPAVCKVINFLKFLGDDAHIQMSTDPAVQLDDLRCRQKLTAIASKLQELKMGGNICTFPTPADLSGMGITERMPDGNVHRTLNPDGSINTKLYINQDEAVLANCGPDSPAFWALVELLIHEGSHAACCDRHPGAMNSTIMLLDWFLEAYHRITPPSASTPGTPPVVWPTPSPSGPFLPEATADLIREGKSREKFFTVLMTPGTGRHLRQICFGASDPIKKDAMLRFFRLVAIACDELPDMIPDETSIDAVPSSTGGPNCWSFDSDGRAGPMKAFKLIVVCDEVGVWVTIKWACGTFRSRIR